MEKYLCGSKKSDNNVVFYDELHIIDNNKLEQDEP